jgi:hypothetical protein
MLNLLMNSMLKPVHFGFSWFAEKEKGYGCISQSVGDATCSLIEFDESPAVHNCCVIMALGAVHVEKCNEKSDFGLFMRQKIRQHVKNFCGKNLLLRSSK